MRLTDKQRGVLHCVLLLRNDSLPATEAQVFCKGRDLGMWTEGLLYGHLRKLTDRGLLERHGPRGGYRYTLTRDGLAAIRGGA